MPTTTTRQLSRAQWLVDWANAPRDLGAQIDWASVDPARLDASGKKYVPDGAIMAQLASGKYVPRDDVDISPAPGSVLGTETAVGLLVGQANEGDRTDALTGYGLLRGGVVYENILPDKGHANFATWLGEMAANGSQFIYLTHTNTAAA